jgi:hypothetical protein
MSKRDELVEVEVRFMRADALNWWVMNHHNVRVNLPLSKIEVPDEPLEGTKIKLEVPAWLCEVKDLI